MFYLLKVVKVDVLNKGRLLWLCACFISVINCILIKKLYGDRSSLLLWEFRFNPICSLKYLRVSQICLFKFYLMCTFEEH